jgi:hypothetical protein
MLPNQANVPAFLLASAELRLHEEFHHQEVLRCYSAEQSLLHRTRREDFEAQLRQQNRSEELLT